MAPAHDPDPLGIDVRQLRFQIVDGAHHIVHFVSAVIDCFVERLAKSRAAAILGRDDHVAAFDCFLDERKIERIHIAVDAAVHPDHGGMAARPALGQRLEQIGRDVEVADAASVRHLLKIDHAFRGFGKSRIGLFLLLDVALEIVTEREIVGLVADVELLGALRIHLRFVRRRSTLAAGLLLCHRQPGRHHRRDADDDGDRCSRERAFHEHLRGYRL